MLDGELKHDQLHGGPAHGIVIVQIGFHDLLQLGKIGNFIVRFLIGIRYEIVAEYQCSNLQQHLCAIQHRSSKSRTCSSRNCFAGCALAGTRCSSSLFISCFNTSFITILAVVKNACRSLSSINRS